MSITIYPGRSYEENGVSTFSFLNQESFQDTIPEMRLANGNFFGLFDKIVGPDNVDYCGHVSREDLETGVEKYEEDGVHLHHLGYMNGLREMLSFCKRNDVDTVVWA